MQNTQTTIAMEIPMTIDMTIPVTVVTPQLHWDTSYAKTIPGYLKIAEIVNINIEIRPGLVFKKTLYVLGCWFHRLHMRLNHSMVWKWFVDSVCVHQWPLVHWFIADWTHASPL